MNFYVFTYPYSDHIVCSEYAPFGNDEEAIEFAMHMLGADLETTDMLDPEYSTYGGRITIIRVTASGERVYSKAIADVDFVRECEVCPDCGASTFFEVTRHAA